MGGRLGSLRLFQGGTQTSEVPDDAIRVDETLLILPQKGARVKSRSDEEARARAAVLDRWERGELTWREACREACMSKSRLFQLRTAYRERGIEGLMPAYREIRVEKRVPQRVEAAVVAYALLHVKPGEKAIRHALAQADMGGITISRHGVGEILRRNGLSSREARERRAAQIARQRTIESPEANQFSKLYAKYRAFVHAICAKAVGDPNLVEDATQETFVRVFTNISSYDPDRNVVAWLRTIATNTCTDILRARGKKPVLEEGTEETWGTIASAEDVIETIDLREQRSKLGSALKALPPRQRRALLLHAIEGWSYKDIASAEDVSIEAVKSLLFRARDELRKRREEGLLGVVIGRVRARLHRLAERVDTAAPSLFTGAFERGVLATVMALGVGFSTMPAAGVQRAATTFLPSREVAAHVEGPRGAAAPTRSGGSSSGSRSDLVDGLMDPTKNATPEETQFQSIVASPSYEHDHTAFAAGAVGCAQPSCNAVLFVSRDGGASWQRLAARGLQGTQIVLPPAYPTDARIFAMGVAGLQVSTDGGVSFTVASPLTGGTAISPAFDTGSADRRILIGGTGTIMEYWPDQNGVAKPAPLILAPRQFSNVAFAPDYVTSTLIFVGSRSVNTGSAYGSMIDRCDGAVCTSIALPTLGDPNFAFSPSFATDGVMYAYTGQSLFRSDDRGRSFQPIAFPTAFGGYSFVTSITIEPASKKLFVGYSSLDRRGSGVAVLSGEGRVWTPLSIALSGFRLGVQMIVITSTNRILAAGIGGGLACSVDNGASWSSRCSG